MMPRATGVVLALLLVGCGTDENSQGSTSSGGAATSSSTTPPAEAAVAPDMEALAASFSDNRLEGATVDVVGGSVQISTRLFRDAESGPAALGICIGAQEFGAEGEIQVLGSDGGVIASTRNELCGIRVE